MDSDTNIYEQIVCKFLLNLPKEEIEDSSRLIYQAEKAFYYYLDCVLKTTDLSDWKRQKK